LELLPGHLTPGLVERLVRLGAWPPFEPAAALLGHFAKVGVSEATARRTEQAGAAYAAAQEAEVAALERSYRPRRPRPQPTTPTSPTVAPARRPTPPRPAATHPWRRAVIPTDRRQRQANSPRKKLTRTRQDGAGARDHDYKTFRWIVVSGPSAKLHEGVDGQDAAAFGVDEEWVDIKNLEAVAEGEG
jgi:hypothetical protein